MQNLIRSNFTQIPNELINDANIDRSARFLFIYLASKPDNWKYYNSELCKALGCSEDTLRKYMNELIAAGWITKIQRTKPDGTFATCDITLNPFPNFSGTVKPSPKKSGTAKNRGGKTTVHSNTDSNNNTELFSNTEILPLPNQIIMYLNSQRGGSGFKLVASNFTEIKARIKEGYSFEDFKKVIDSKIIQWLRDDKNKMYLRPETLFGKKMNGYLEVADVIISKSVDSGSNNFEYNPQEEAQLK